MQIYKDSVSAKKLKEICKKNNIYSESASSVINAIKKISSKEKKTIVAFGSLYLISSFLKKNN
jgi:folylpolyglutamate synthase/dihydropteroate synthase